MLKESITISKNFGLHSAFVCEGGPKFDLDGCTPEDPKSAHAIPVACEKGSTIEECSYKKCVKRKGKELIIADDDFVEEVIVLTDPKRCKVDEGVRKKKKFTNIAVNAREVAAFRLPEARDYEFEYQEINGNYKLDHASNKAGNEGLQTLDNVIKQFNKLCSEVKKGRSEYETFNKEITDELGSVKNYMTDQFQQIFAELKKLNRWGYDTLDSKVKFNNEELLQIDQEPNERLGHRVVVEDAHVDADNQRKSYSVWDAELLNSDTVILNDSGCKSDFKGGVQIDKHWNEVNKGERLITIDDYEEPQITESQIVAIERKFMHNRTPQLKETVRLPGKHKSSPFDEEFMSDINGDAQIDKRWNDENKEKRVMTLDDYEEPLITESQIVEIERKFLEKRSRQLKKTVSLLGKHKKSPFVQEFSSGGSGAKYRPHIFETKHPFLVYIRAALDIENVAQFNEWMLCGIDKKTKRRKTPFSKEDNMLSEPFELGVVRVDKRDWFYSMSQVGQPWNDKHIDVIMYYLRKKGKYGPDNPVTFTTTDCRFKSRMVQAYNHYWMSKDDDTVESVNANDPVIQYMLGRRLLANVPWDQVDYVIFPCSIAKKYHWILIVFNIVNMSLIVYDSCTSDKHNVAVCEVVDAFSTMIPIFLKMSGFYEKRYSIAPIHPEKSIRVTMLNNSLPHQDSKSLDSGVYVAVFAEYATVGQVTPKDDFDVQFHRMRYASLLWSYARKKQELGAISESEVCGSLGRRKVDAQKKRCQIIRYENN